MNLHSQYYRMFGITDYWVRLSLPDLENSAKFVGDPEKWRQAEQVINEAMAELDFPYETVRGDRKSVV